ncbi:MAG: FAD-dependent oxidoreductase [Bacteroidota bacterium]
MVTEFQKIGGNYLIDHVLKVEGSEKIEALLTQQNGRIISDLYVFACGPWIVKLFPELEKYIYTSRQEVYYFQDNLQLKVGQLPMWLEFQSNDEMYYGIPDHFNRGFKASYDSRNLIFDPDKDDRILTPELIDNMRDYLGYRFPMLKDSRLVEGRVCQYENSLDGDFIIDLLPDRSNGIILGGTSGHGYKMAPAIGEMVVNHLNKGAAFPQKFELDRFQHLSHKTTQFS